MDRKLLKNLDYSVVITVCILLSYSLFIITSASFGQFADVYYYLKRQIVWDILGISILIFILSIDYNVIKKASRYLYGFMIVLLLAVLLIGAEHGGAKSWIDIGPFSMQPSEFSKIIIIIILAKYLSENETLIKTWRGIFLAFLYVGIPLLFILKQPDLGTALVFFAILFGMLFAGGVPIKKLMLIAGSGIAALPILWNFLDKYQKNRLIVFIDPNVDPLGAGYHVIQSKIAVGSGGLMGKGLFKGTQNLLNFLPEQHTDFIFSVIGEELGFIGAIVLLSLYLFLLWKGIKIAMAAKDKFGTLLVVGVLSMYTFHILENVGMTIGLMPITGIPLPFMSYGGSSTLANMIALGIILNVRMRRQKIMF